MNTVPNRLRVAADLLEDRSPDRAHAIIKEISAVVGRAVDILSDPTCLRTSVEWEDADRTRARAIVRECADELGVRVPVLLGDRRRPRLVAARRKAASRLRDEMSLGYPAIGQALGGRHHTTIMNLLGLLEKNRKAGREAGA